MAGDVVVALDLGTGSARAIVFDRSGSLIAQAAREWRHYPEGGVPGSQVFDTASNWALLSTCISEALEVSRTPPERVAAVSASSMREGIVLVDESGTEVWACPNVDSRAASEAEELVRSGTARKIYDIAGDWVSITSPARLLWLKTHNPEVLERTQTLMMLSDWAAFRLCGSTVTEPSAGSSSGMFDLAVRDWSEEVVRWVGIDAAILPDVVEPGTKIGEVSAEGATACGLSPGTPVVAGGADTQLALVGLGSSKSGAATVIGGTFWQSTYVTDRPIIDPEARLRTLCHSEVNEWMTEGIGFYSGQALRWFRDGFCQLETETAIREGRDVYSVMERSAGSAPPDPAG